MPTEKAKRETILVGSLEIERFMVPDGSDRMSQTQSAERIGLGAQNTSQFFQSRAFQASRGNGSTDHGFDPSDGGDL